MAIDYWFPTVIYREILTPSSDTTQAMLDYINKFRFKHKETYSVTGDTVNEYRIAEQPEFSWLNKEVLRHCYLYLEEYGLDTNKLCIFVSKAWPVVCNPAKIAKEDCVIQKHNHANSHLSVVFYLQTDRNHGGEITFHNSPTHPIRYVPFAPLLKEQKIPSLDCIEYKPIHNQLLIFPSSVEHEVSLYYGAISRYSITYDIIITGKETLDGDNEMCVINPKNWKELNA